MKFLSIKQDVFKYLLFIFLIFTSFNCSAIFQTVLNDNYLGEGDYIFIMYDNWGEKLIFQGQMNFYTNNDTNLSGTYLIKYNSDNTIPNEGLIAGIINKKDGKAGFNFGDNIFGQINVKIDNYINLADGEWNYRFQKGRFVLFKKDYQN